MHTHILQYSYYLSASSKHSIRTSSVRLPSEFWIEENDMRTSHLSTGAWQTPIFNNSVGGNNDIRPHPTGCTQWDEALARWYRQPMENQMMKYLMYSGNWDEIEDHRNIQYDGSLRGIKKPWEWLKHHRWADGAYALLRMIITDSIMLFPWQEEFNESAPQVMK